MTKQIPRALRTALVVGLLAGGAEAYPPAPGFNAEASDQKAVAVADRVMEKLGGYEAWKATRYLAWDFFGRGRFHVWDKHTGNLRYEDEDWTVLMNLHSKEGRAWRDGQEVTDPDSLKRVLHRIEGRWINDSYWMFMPYKLKDTGVTLKYLGEEESSDGAACDVLELTFENVGRTPQNKYHVYVDKKTALVVQWDYYRNAEAPEPRMSTPWSDWKRHGKILLSAVRGENRKHDRVAVYESLPNRVFTDPSPVDWARYE